MTVALLAALAALAAPGPVDSRIQESAAAAQALQGPLDGSWTLRDPAGTPLFVFQINDPAGGGPIGCAWRDPRSRTTDPALVTTIRRTTSTLSMTFGAPTERLTLRAIAPDRWRGRLAGANQDGPVTLERR